MNNDYGTNVRSGETFTLQVCGLETGRSSVCAYQNLIQYLKDRPISIPPLVLAKNVSTAWPDLISKFDRLEVDQTINCENQPIGKMSIGIMCVRNECPICHPILYRYYMTYTIYILLNQSLLKIQFECQLINGILKYKMAS